MASVASSIRNILRVIRDRTIGSPHAVRTNGPTAVADAPQAAPPVVHDLAGQLQAAGTTVDEFLAAWRTAPRIHIGPNDEAIAALHDVAPEIVAETIAAAERFQWHVFDLLGSGPYRAVDPERPTIAGYEPIDWYLDPIRDTRFPGDVPHREWNFERHRPADSDIKLPWELGRCQHWVTLAQAYRLTGRDEFAVEVARQMRDFVEANPVGRGVNWVCTMDVGLRTASWAIAFDLLRNCDALDDGFWHDALQALFDHAEFVFHNFENHYEVTSNHYLSNVVGLAFAAAIFRDLPRGGEWFDYCHEHLEIEMKAQVLPDGADYESSIPYHRLVTELFLGSARLFEFHERPLSDEYAAALRRMIDFANHTTRPDGLMPQIGDADDGRLHVLRPADWQNPQDGRHLFPIAERMLGNVPTVRLPADRDAWEAAWWGLPSDATTDATALPRHDHFADAGIAVARSERCYLLVSNGIVGTSGFGNHKHNDQLSFEYHWDGAAFVVDPGSHVYTPQPDSRNRFRATAYHNTLRIDDIEQNELKPEYLFRMFETVPPETEAVTRDGNRFEFVGRQLGYRDRIEGSPIHERRFEADLETGALEITDIVRGNGRHDLAWHFHLAPGVTATLGDGNTIELRSNRGTVNLTFDGSLTPTIVEAEYSPSYGVAVPCLAIDLVTTADVTPERAWHFTLSPA